MKVIVQRVSQAQVSIIDEATGDADSTIPVQRIDHGLVALVGVSDTDTMQTVEWMARKIANMRIFEDDQGKMNRSVLEVRGSILSVSQFTLFAAVKHGNRPSFTEAGNPEHAKRLWLAFNEALRVYGVTVREGQFAAHMQVSLVNDGPVTIPIDTDHLH